MKKVLSVAMSFCLIILMLQSTFIVAFAESTDYVSIFGEFVDYKNNNRNLYDFLMKNYFVASVDHFCDCYMVDLDNNSVPELLCLFMDSDHGDVVGYTVCIEYDNGFKMGSKIPFDFSDGSGGSLLYRVLEQDGKFYFEECFSSHYSDGVISKSEIKQTITLNNNGTDVTAYNATLKGTTNMMAGEENYEIVINGQKAKEFDYEYVLNNFNIVASSADYNYNPYTTETVQYNYGKNYAQYWKTKNNSIKVIIDNKPVSFDQQPIIVDGRTLVPLRAIFEEFGASVEWDGHTQTVTSIKGNITISMLIGKKEMYKNGKIISLDVPPQIVGERTLVPVRAIAEAFGCDVSWDGENQTVVINK